MEPEEIFINLKVLESLDKDQKAELWSIYECRTSKYNT